MIRLSKRPRPEILAQMAAAWTEEYLRAVKAGGAILEDIRYRYRHPLVREHLQIETRDKCAYCESKIRHVTPDHIEHILAKSARPDLIVDWSNLTIACPVCNHSKGDYYSV